MYSVRAAAVPQDVVLVSRPPSPDWAAAAAVDGAEGGQAEQAGAGGRLAVAGARPGFQRAVGGDEAAAV